MKITIAKTAGFCMGVRRAVDMVLDAANKTNEPICTFGPLIHNPQVLHMLEEKGIPAIREIPEKGEGTVLIRAHGVPPCEQQALKRAGFKVINATCPRVIRVQTIIRKHAEKGYSAIIVGDADHPEVKGLMGYAGVGEDGNTRGFTVSGVDELASLPGFENAIVVAQTTQDTALYDEIKRWISEHHPHYKIFDTICDSTEKRQAETRRIAKESDVVVVVGGKESGNTRRLAQIASESVSREHDSRAFAVHIEDVSELDISKLAWADSIALTAGASTPNWTISQTCRAIESSLQKSESSFSAWMLRCRNFMLRSNFLLSAGAGTLTYACSSIQGIDRNLVHALVSMLYILSMQILNNLFSIKSDKYNNPERAEFYDSNKVLLTTTAIVSGAAGIYLSYTTGVVPFIILCFMSLLGLGYNRKIFPGFSFLSRRIMRIKDIPGSKTVLIAVAWGTVTSLLPALSGISSGLGTSSTGGAVISRISFIIPFIFSTSLLFARTSFFAVLEIQGDRITGKETIPIILGEKKSMKLIVNFLTGSAILISAAAFAGLIEISGVALASVPLFMLLVIKLHSKGRIHSGMNLEFIIESHFIMAGIIAAIFQV